jgi:hypothetical protein
VAERASPYRGDSQDGTEAQRGIVGSRIFNYGSVSQAPESWRHGETIVPIFIGRGAPATPEPAVATACPPFPRHFSLLERFPADLNLFLPLGFRNSRKSDSLIVTYRSEGDHGKRLFDGLEKSCGGLGRGR